MWSRTFKALFEQLPCRARDERGLGKLPLRSGDNEAFSEEA